MKWTSQAEEAISKVPFFIRKRVRKKVEQEARDRGDHEVNLRHVETCQKNFRSNMENEVKGFRIEACFRGCPNRAIVSDDMLKKLEDKLERKNLKAFLKKRVNGPLKIHHEFVLSVSDCPNACSRPQIVDLGLIGSRQPEVSEKGCSQCQACIKNCQEKAICLPDNSAVIDTNRCCFCGQCINVCPTGTIREAKQGYRILIGGKLGRHPQLGQQLPGIFSIRQTLDMVELCLGYYKKYNLRGERFGEIINREGLLSELLKATSGLIPGN